MDKYFETYACPHCTHPGFQHSEYVDWLGYIAFCRVPECPCYVEERDEKKKN